jgi:hypothetical protein
MAGSEKDVASITADEAFKFRDKCTDDAQNTDVVLAKAGTHNHRCWSLRS